MLPTNTRSRSTLIPRGSRARSPRVAVAAAALLVVAVSCASSNDETRPVAGGDGSLSGVCPNPVVIQTNWYPQAEYGPVYALLGERVAVDEDGKRVRGPLVDRGRDTGVEVEIRTGGPATGFTQVSTLMRLDNSIHLGGVATDEAVQNSKDQPTVAVFAPMDLNPQIILWDPQSHPGWNTVVDIGQSDATVLYQQGAAFMEFLVGSGLLRKDQLDGGYDGTPARFVAEHGQIAQQGYVTNEVYAYEHEVDQWGRPVRFQLIHDMGYPIYPDPLAIRAADLEKLAPCLERLVPILQRATVAYIQDPEPINARIVELAEAFDGFPYSIDRARFAAEQMTTLGILGNGPNQTIGDLNPDRVQRCIDILAPIFAAQEKPIQPELTPEHIATNRFIDPTIGLPS